ncbi:MAG: glycosyl hydrolase 53 family protein, partial [Clostridia bacterium]|nr:glycosyl hydrolase 53 family protein [Clostridia bacterium]
DPCAFPVHHADAAGHAVDHGVGDIADGVGLALHGEGVILHDRAAVADGVAVKVGICAGVGIGGLHDHDFLAIGFGDFCHHGGEILQRAVPVGIIGGGEYIVVHVVVGHLLGIGGVVADLLGIGEVQGQANSIRDITDTVVNGMPGGIGVVYWEGTWISVGGSSWEENSALWEKYGSGWASSYAAGYDPNDAGKYYGGNAVDNQAMFDAEGKALESLKVFKLMREGNEVALKADALEDVTIICDLNAELVLPETVNAIMNDDSKQAIPVEWNLTDEQRAIMRSGGVAQYDITGNAGGMEAHCYVSMVEYNYLTDYSFEEGGQDWTLTDLAKADELYIEDKKTDSLTGTKHVHFWSAASGSVEFTAEQTVTDLPEGKFKFTISIMGGDAGTTDIYAYVKINGEIVATAPLTITSYGNWDTAVIPEFTHASGDTVAVGVYVKCQGSGNGAWGKIDDAMLNSVK